jgi:exodeoxyribonuclease V beta subunit
MIPLDTRSFPLVGSSLIEASAGTGKTYTIVNLYLRLLLGDECQPLSVDKILVVTFTNAATAELKQRIRQRLRSAYLDFYAGASSDDFIQYLITRSADLALDCQRLLLAGKQMDEAAVFTIHGFCQRMLTQHAFESGTLYEQSLILDESQWLKLAVEDYWRSHIVPLPLTILSPLLKIWAAPGHLRNSLQSLLYRKVRPLQDVQVGDAHQAVESYAAGVADMKRWWLDNNVAEQLLGADLKGNTKLGKSTIIRDMQAFCQSGDLEPSFDKQPWGVFTPDKVQGARKKTSKDLSDLDFSRFQWLVTQQKTASDALLQAYSGDALTHCAHNLAHNKERLQLLSPDDLLMNLHHALAEQAGKPEPEHILASAIQGEYPVALIDEFQDTDATQFAIFSLIYTPQYHDNPPCWVAIGDPKQAIYAFRGADIFTYIEAKQLVSAERQFTLATNWRSQPALVEAVNGLFSQSEAGFLFEEHIPFYGVQSVKQPPGLVIGDTAQACLQFHHLTATDGLPIGWALAQSVMAQRTAGQIAQFLSGEQGQIKVGNQPLRAGDCCVLVRDRIEADAIKQALGRHAIDSVFLARKSVFASQTAVDLFALLQALAEPGNDRFLRSALVSELFTYDALALDILFNHELHWQQLVEQFIYWHQQWQRHGLMMAVNLLLRHFAVAEKLVEHYGDGQRRLTDLRHLIELLQVQSQLMSGQSQLLHWFAERLAEPDHNHEGQQIRLETEENLVQIITQHTSKGLEFPLVFIPFASRYRAAKDAIYHHGEQGLVVDFLAEEQTLQQADHERLAEDIRLLYVALTRAVHYCFVGIWNNAHTQRKKESQLQLTALGRVLFKAGEPINEALIARRLTDLQHNLDVAYCPFDASQVAGGNSPNSQPGLPLEAAPVPVHEKSHWQVAHLERPVQRKWRLTSYSAISSQQQHIEFIAPGLDEGVDKADLTVLFANAESGDSQDGAEIITNQADEVVGVLTSDIQPMDQFAFTRGPQAGSFLHGVLENIEFMHPVELAESIAQQGKWYGIDEVWYPMLQIWLADILRAPFTAEPGGVCLAQLSQRQVLVEMEFHLPLREVHAGQFNQLLNRFYPQRQHNYQFEQLHGMLKGYIDLTFEYNGMFYVADYKSNHLGDSLEHYTPGALEQAMTEHDYQLQAILYTLALHRWLGIKVGDYQYETHIGGAYYLFLRGMNSQDPGAGVFHMLPDKALIVALDALFAGHYTGDLSKASIATDTQADTTQGQLDLW